MLTSFRRLPLFARIAAVMLVLVATGGQYWQRRPVGRLSLTTLHLLRSTCPALPQMGDKPAVADGAHALDYAAWRLILDQVAPQLTSRCDGEKDAGVSTS